jgi:hypothetical protein
MEAGQGPNWGRSANEKKKKLCNFLNPPVAPIFLGQNNILKLRQYYPLLSVSITHEISQQELGSWPQKVANEILHEWNIVGRVRLQRTMQKSRPCPDSDLQTSNHRFRGRLHDPGTGGEEVELH